MSDAGEKNDDGGERVRTLIPNAISADCEAAATIGLDMSNETLRHFGIHRTHIAAFLAANSADFGAVPTSDENAETRVFRTLIMDSGTWMPCLLMQVCVPPLQEFWTVFLTQTRETFVVRNHAGTYTDSLDMVRDVGIRTAKRLFYEDNPLIARSSEDVMECGMATHLAFTVALRHWMRTREGRDSVPFAIWDVEPYRFNMIHVDQK